MTDIVIEVLCAIVVALILISFYSVGQTKSISQKKLGDLESTPEKKLLGGTFIFNQSNPH